MTIGSLFSGIGGLELGLESLGLCPVLWQCDSDPCARAVLEAHWPGVKRFNDVKEIDATAERVGILCGGFPCQGISDAGPRTGLDDPRSGLWREYLRVIRELRPGIVFVENVAALVGRGLQHVLGDLAALGFDAEWGVLSACAVGAPHTRERLFVLAYSDGQLGATRLRDCLDQGRWSVQRRAQETSAEHLWVASDGDVRGMADGTASEVDRIRLCGNACVPAQAARAFVELARRAVA